MNNKFNIVNSLNMTLLSILLMLSVNFSLAQETDNVITFQLGEATISTLSEGQQQSGTSNLIGATPEILKKYVPDGAYPSATNAFLIRINNKNILIDAGYGRNLFANLQSLEITADKVDIILLTHMHGDHIGGLLKDGKITFPNAELYIPQPEHDYWTSDNAMNQAPENRRNAFLQSRSVIAAYKNKLHLFVPAESGATNPELMPGIKAVAAYGHTPGHTAYLIESDGSKLLVWGDLTHAMSLQMPHPEIALTYDVNPDKAIDSRKKLLDYVAKNKISIAGMHIAFPSVGDIKVNNKDKGYIYTPFCTCLGL